MAFIGQHLRVTWIFTVNGTEEIADTSLKLAGSGTWTGAVAALNSLDSGDLSSFAGSYAAMVTLTGGRWADYSHLSAVKVAAVGPDGHYLADPISGPPASSTAGTVIGNPIQCTQVVSLRAATRVGKGKRGRMFLPHFYMSVLTANPHTDGGQSAVLADQAATFIHEINVTASAAAGSAIQTYIFGQTGVGTKEVVSRVSVGNVIDTQRRRRDQLSETYADHSV